MMESPTDRKSRQRENDVWDADSDVFSLGGDEEEDTPQPEQHQQRVQQQAAMNHGQAPV